MVYIQLNSNIFTKVFEQCYIYFDFQYAVNYDMYGLCETISLIQNVFVQLWNSEHNRTSSDC